MTTNLFTYHATVPGEWVDHNQHMNDAEYNRFFSDATDAFIRCLGLSTETINELSYTIFTLENHTIYLKEVKQDALITGEVMLYDYDTKRLHLFIRLYDNTHEVCATYEVMLMGIDQKSHRSSPFPEKIYQAVKSYSSKQSASETPNQIGSTIGIKRK